MWREWNVAETDHAHEPCHGRNDDAHCRRARGPMEFDLRAYSLQSIIGIRIRYGGGDFNPFVYSDDDDSYMGVRLIESMCEHTMYQRTFGTNTVQVLIEGGNS